METSARLLRVYLSNTDKVDHTPLYEAIVYLAKQRNIKGATVLKGIMGFGGSTAILSASMWEITDKLPVVVELIDEATKISEFQMELKQLLGRSNKGTLVTVQDVDVIFSTIGKSH